MNPDQVLDALCSAHPELGMCKDDIGRAYEAIIGAYHDGGKLLVCGNGGSASDAEHIVGELMKGFTRSRPLDEGLKEALIKADPERGALLAGKLQGALPAVSLVNSSALISAILNDTDPKLVYAQQVLGLGKRGDILIGMSTSGNAENVLHAFGTARVLGLTTIGLSGESGGRMVGRCDILVRVPGRSPACVQEYHLPVYHALCTMVEVHFFDE